MANPHSQTYIFMKSAAQKYRSGRVSLLYGYILFNIVHAH